MCGNYDGDFVNEYKKVDGSEGIVMDFVNSWVVFISCLVVFVGIFFEIVFCFVSVYRLFYKFIYWF